jgi:hypothetical protein
MPYMKCKDVHAYYQNDPRAAILRSPDSAELLEHVASCAQCNQLIEEGKQVAECLRLMRNAAPAMSASLDGTVLDRYRGLLSESHAAAPALVTSPIRAGRTFAWAAAATLAVVACGAIFLLMPRPGNRTERHAAKQQPVVAPQRVAAAREEMVPLRQQARQKPKSFAASTKHANHASSVAKPSNWFPANFQSLMYCDQISCPGTMDIVRVQLPSPILGVTPVSALEGGLVSADVLVGADGIARGIRIVE